MEQKRFVNNKLMRYGYTTGTCAAAAAGAATTMLLTGQPVTAMHIQTPKGIPVDVEILEPSMGPELVSCAVRKDGGDDPDMTNGLLICACVRRIDSGIVIDGGEGVGRVTKPGLDQPVGNAAINSTPRRMITQTVSEACTAAGYTGGISVVISVPRGAEVGAKTFNPYLGIVGGISILGTSGIVEPMSDQAIIDSARAEISVLRQSGADSLLMTIGNYGERFARENLHLDLSKRMKCSNFIGDALSDAIELGFQSVLLIGHIGKMIKLGAGIMNTHSARGDARMEIMTACALEAGADLETLRTILGCATTDAAVEILANQGLLEPTMQVLAARITRYLDRRIGDHIRYGVIVFINNDVRSQVLCTCGAADELIGNWRIPND